MRKRIDKAFNQSVTRNIDRFPENFRFQLTKEEYDVLRSQNATSNERGGRRYLPYVFTEQGIIEAIEYYLAYVLIAVFSPFNFIEFVLMKKAAART